MSEPVLELRGIGKSYGGFTAVKQLDFAVAKGSIFGFLGPNGAGKTTTLRIILDIIRPDKGNLSVLGQPDASRLRDRIGYLPEERGLYKKMTAAKVIAYFAKLKGVKSKDARARAYELLDQFGLGDFADSKVEALSKGMAQKVQVLTAIAHDPELVILDEPFSGLDPVNQLVLEDLIRGLARRGRTVIFSTHVMEHAERLCDHLLFVAKGEKIFDGTLAQARATTPRRVRLEAQNGIGDLAELDGVVSVVPPTKEMPAAEGGARRYWEVRLKQGANPQDILKACFERNIQLNHFDLSEPSLHEIFVNLVGLDSREAAYR